MMTNMRRSMPLILWILVIAFVGTIIFSWGMGGFKEKTKPGVVGIIEGMEISNEFYNDLVSKEIELQYRDTGVRPEEAAERDIRNRIWESLVEETLISREINQRGLTVSDSEVVMVMLNNPFDFIRENPYFQTDEQFDFDKYHAFLQDPRSKQYVIEWERSYHQSLLKQKLVFQILSTVEVTYTELVRRFEERNVMGRAKFVIFAADSMAVDSSEISPTEIENYYFEHLEDYKVEEKRRIVYSQLDYVATAEDSADIRALANEMESRLSQGADFGNLAVLYSDHHTASDSGYLGWMPKKQLEAISDSAVWITAVGDYTGSLENRYGVHFYKVIDRGMQEGKLKSELLIIQLKFFPSSDTKDMITNKMQNFSEDIMEGDFLRTAELFELEVDTSGYFPRGTFIPGLGKIKSAVDFAFAKPVGTTSELYPLRNGWLAFKLIDIQPEHNKPLEEVRDGIFRELYHEQRLQAARVECERFLVELPDKSEWAEKAVENGMTIHETESEFRFGDYVNIAGRDLAFTSVLLRSEAGEMNGPILGDNGCYLIELTEKTHIDTAEFYRGQAEYMPRLLQGKQQIAYKEWYSELKKKAQIEDFRYLYYRKL